MIVQDVETERFLDLVGENYSTAEVLEVFPVHLSGWESDNRAAVVSTGGSPFVLTTSCGSLLRLTNPGGYLGERLRAHTEPDVEQPFLSLVA